jgi:hypothetical protein
MHSNFSEQAGMRRTLVGGIWVKWHIDGALQLRILNSGASSTGNGYYLFRYDRFLRATPHLLGRNKRVR